MKKYFLSFTFVLILAIGFAFVVDAVSMRTKISEKTKSFTQKLEKLKPKLLRKKKIPPAQPISSSQQQFADLAVDFAVQFLELQELTKPSKKSRRCI